MGVGGGDVSQFRGEEEEEEERIFTGLEEGGGTITPAICGRGGEMALVGASSSSSFSATVAKGIAAGPLLSSSSRFRNWIGTHAHVGFASKKSALSGLLRFELPQAIQGKEGNCMQSSGFMCPERLRNRSTLLKEGRKRELLLDLSLNLATHLLALKIRKEKER